MYSKNKAVKKTLLIVVCVFLLCSFFSVIAGANSVSNLTLSDDLMAAVAAGEIDPESNVFLQRGISSESIVTPRIQIDGVHCLNNAYAGQYLRNYASVLDARSGYISSLGNPIRWNLSTTNNVTTIQSVSDSTKYLGVTNNSANASVTLFTVNSGAAIPANCKWTIRIASGGGCLIKNNYNSGYLSSFGSDDGITVEPTLPSAPVAYKSRVWRVSKPSYISGRELNAQTVMPECYIMKNYPTVFLFRKAPDNALWTNYLDFSYNPRSSFLSVDYQTGKITGTAVGTGSITVTHKPTGRAFTLTVKVYNPSTNKGLLDHWYDRESHVIGRWNAAPSIYTEKLNSVDGFKFLEGATNARNAWGSVLGLNLTLTSSSAADIRMYGGTATQLATVGGNLGPTDVGLTKSDYTITGYYTHNNERKLHAKMLSARVYILSRSVSADSITNVCTHELGHAFGYIGHSTHSASIMHYQPSEITELTTYDRGHLYQVYN